MTTTIKDTIKFIANDHGWDTVGGKYHCEIVKKPRGQYAIYRNTKLYTASSFDGAKRMAVNLSIHGS